MGAKAHHEIEPERKAVRANAANRPPGPDADQQRQQANLHALETPVVDRKVEGGETHCRQGHRDAVIRQVLGYPLHEVEIRQQQKGRGDLNEETALRRSYRQKVRQSHVQGPERVCEALDRRAGEIPHETVPIRQAAGVPHRNHGVVEQREITLAVDDKARPVDERSRIAGGRQDQSSEENGSFVRSGHYPVPLPGSWTAEANIITWPSRLSSRCCSAACFTC